MRETRISCDKFNFISILGVEGRKAANEHAKIKVRGHISETSDEYVLHNSAGQGVTFTASDSEGEKQIFGGIIDEIEIHTENEMRILTVSVLSRSTLMDLTPYTRTFQNPAMTFTDVTTLMTSEKADWGFLLPDIGGRSIGSMVVQHNKTDWEHSKYLAQKAGTVVVPDYLLNAPYISIGIPKRSPKSGIDAISYTVKKDVHQFRNMDGSISERDAVSYIVKSREILDLCDRIPFAGLSLLVWAIDTYYEGAQLVHYYTLREEGGFFTQEKFNEYLIGVSLRGTVIEIVEDKVRVNIHGDVAQSEHKWFQYSTPFSQPDGYGWYFMPEVGDEVRVQFPSEDENEAYVTSAVHVTHGSRANPGVKFIRTVYGQTIQFDPEKILIDDGAGSSITMHKDEGISLETNKNAKIEAGSEITMSAAGKVLITGGRGVVMQKGDSAISVDDVIDISAEHTRIQ